MWDDVKIGDGLTGSSALYAVELSNGGSVSENAVSYWISNAYLRLGMRVMKATPEGKAITLFLNTKEDPTAYVESLVLKHAEPERLREAIKAHWQMGHREGVRYAQATMRVALGLT